MALVGEAQPSFLGLADRISDRAVDDFAVDDFA
jgi:hypothetical protein